MNGKKLGLALLSLAVMAVLAIGCVCLQNFMHELTNAKEAEVFWPEMRDQYNQYGLPDHTELSKEIIVQNDTEVIYTDRIFTLGQLTKSDAQYAIKAADALLKIEPQIEKLYIMPIPERAVFEEGYETEREAYQTLIENLQNSVHEGEVILDPLEELLAHQEEYIYFRTHNSWTMRGAFYGMQVMRKALGLEEEDLNGYRTYMFGDFTGSLLTHATAEYKDTEYEEAIDEMEGDPFYIYIKGHNPNREELTFRNAQGELKTMKRGTILMNSNGPSSVVGGSYYHSVVSGNGKGSIILIADSLGKLLVSYLSQLYETVYVVKADEDALFAEEVNKVVSEYGVHEVLWAQRASEIGDASYMKAWNTLLRKEGMAND